VDSEFKATLSVFSLFSDDTTTTATTDDVDDRRRDAGHGFVFVFFFFFVVRSIAKDARTTGERTGTRE
jgi:hypothetical protein